MRLRLASLVLVLFGCRPAAEPAKSGEPEPAARPEPAAEPEAATTPEAELDAAAIAAIVAHPARPADERALDPGRLPDALLQFLALRPGMRLADLGAGRGYTTFLLAQAVGPAG